MCETNNIRPVDDENLATISGGASIGEELDLMCPKCKCVTRARLLTEGVYTCTVCHTNHNGVRPVVLPRA